MYRSISLHNKNKLFVSKQNGKLIYNNFKPVGPERNNLYQVIGSQNGMPKSKCSREETTVSGVGKKVTSTFFYKWIIEGTECLLFLALIDAGYSGDWSRIGAISKEVEEYCKILALVIAAIHLALAYLIAVKEQNSQEGTEWIKTTIKTFLIGATAYAEARFSKTN